MLEEKKSLGHAVHARKKKKITTTGREKTNQIGNKRRGTENRASKRGCCKNKKIKKGGVEKGRQKQSGQHG